MEEVLRDRFGYILGRIQDNGRELVARDKYGNICGRYEKDTNTTKDRLGNKVGTGNLLVALLPISLL